MPKSIQDLNSLTISEIEYVVRFCTNQLLRALGEEQPVRFNIWEACFFHNEINMPFMEMDEFQPLVEKLNELFLSYSRPYPRPTGAYKAHFETNVENILSILNDREPFEFADSSDMLSTIFHVILNYGDFSILVNTASSEIRWESDQSLADQIRNLLEDWVYPDLNENFTKFDYERVLVARIIYNIIYLAKNIQTESECQETRFMPQLISQILRKVLNFESLSKGQMLAITQNPDELTYATSTLLQDTWFNKTFSERYSNILYKIVDAQREEMIIDCIDSQNALLEAEHGLQRAKTSLNPRRRMQTGSLLQSVKLHKLSLQAKSGELDRLETQKVSTHKKDKEEKVEPKSKLVR